MHVNFIFSCLMLKPSSDKKKSGLQIAAKTEVKIEEAK